MECHRLGQMISLDINKILIYCILVIDVFILKILLAFFISF